MVVVVVVWGQGEGEGVAWLGFPSLSLDCGVGGDGCLLRRLR